MVAFDPSTGEVISTASPAKPSWAQLRARAEQIRDQHPETPLEIDRLMREIEELGFVIADFKVQANNERYDAELAYSKRKNAALAKHAVNQKMVTVAKALAEQDAETELQAWLAAKSIYHHVEDIQQALARKHFGLMNTNKGIQGMTATVHRRGV